MFVGRVSREGRIRWPLLACFASARLIETLSYQKGGQLARFECDKAMRFRGQGTLSFVRYASRILGATLLLWGAFASIGGALAQDIPSNLQIVGQISSGASGITPVIGDEVRVVNVDSSATEAVGTILATDGTYFVEMSKFTDFNGTQLTLRLRTGGALFQLVFGSDNTFSFFGAFPFPVRTTINATIGEQFSGGDGGGGDADGAPIAGPAIGGAGAPAEAGTPDARFDVNGDGLFNQADIDLIKQAISASNPNPAADVNGDGIINTRDAVTAIRRLLSVTDRAGRFIGGGSTGDTSN